MIWKNYLVNSLNGAIRKHDQYFVSYFTVETQESRAQAPFLGGWRKLQPGLEQLVSILWFVMAINNVPSALIHRNLPNSPMVKRTSPTVQMDHQVHQFPTPFPNTPQIARIMSYLLNLQKIFMGTFRSDCLDLNPCAVPYQLGNSGKLINLSMP